MRNFIKESSFYKEDEEKRIEEKQDLKDKDKHNLSVISIIISSIALIISITSLLL